MTVFDEAARDLIDGRKFATAATLHARSGDPQTSVVRVLRDGDELLFSTLAGRQKARNPAKDPRISVTVSDRENPYRTVEIRGTAVVTEDVGNTVQHEVSQKYVGRPPPADRAGEVRVVVRISPAKVNYFSV
ncbi:PPOX class F420-dependent oxidoreductase [Streptomyces beijiangensis]|uniref:PPOX class F420-dependent oxidoreductase n=1 Tax=Streptomyces beijiangensis TaxID=163361 RepID=A0A939F665_9ACTN|nr:PPOX class F420-dependent oxidoreductase [Streptomyces beijiangensis]MBO0511737.1 PPOX class F420-dependent oxidoreductase [Streptomyces beijiangensis]